MIQQVRSGKLSARELRKMHSERLKQLAGQTAEQTARPLLGADSSRSIMSTRAAAPPVTLRPERLEDTYFARAIKAVRSATEAVTGVLPGGARPDLVDALGNEVTVLLEAIAPHRQAHASAGGKSTHTAVRRNGS